MGSAPVKVEELDVLLVVPEDVAMLATLLQGGERADLVLRQVGDLAAASEAYRQRPADAVLVVAGPGVDVSGSAVKDLLALNPRPCVLVVTDDDVQGAEAMRAGAEDHLTMGSLAPAVLLRVLGRAIERHAAASRREMVSQGAPARSAAGAGARRLRPPLGVITASLEQLRDGKGEADDLIQQALRAAYALNGEVDQLLAAERRDEAGGRAPVDLNDLLDTVREDLVGLISAGGASVTAAPLPVVWGRRDPLRLMLRQLLLNALQHGESGVSIRVSAEFHARGIRVFVDDDGPGVPPQDRARLFSTHARSSDQRNVGYGLPTVAAVAGQHGGRAWLEDSPFGGTRAVVEIPIRRRDAAAPPLPVSH